MMKRAIIHFIAGIAFLWTGVGTSPATAQTKRLDLQQSLGQKESLTRPIINVRGWADAQHYIVLEPGERQAQQVHVKTGARSPYSPPPASDVSVSVRDNDVFITKGDEE